MIVLEPTCKGDICYYVSSVSLTLSDARSECLSVGGDLPSIASQAEMDYLISIS